MLNITDIIMQKKKIFFKNLDSWRFIAFLSVFLFHSFNTTQPEIFESLTFKKIISIFEYGHLGVDLFFVLSGFLITYLLVSEEEINTKYDILKFWGRRILRIWPLYFMVIIYAFVLFEPLIKLITSKNSIENANLLYYLFFVPNFQLVIEKVYPLNNCLTVLWSVGVEEQFYLFWPLLFFIKKIRSYVLALLVLTSIVFRFLNFEEVMTIKYHTLSVIGVLGLGCILGNYFAKNKIKTESIEINKILNFCIYLFGIFIVIIYPIAFNNQIGVALSTTITGLFFGYLIFEQVFVKNPLFQLGKVKFFDRWGKYTYGLYCLHPLGILISFNITKILKFEQSFLWVVIGETILSLIISMVIAWFSYHIVEKHFLKLKSKISSIVK